ncbi:MAG: aminotransferase class I/II-fold pyridoxal phosphate-dependent enzyme, partial [Sandarakinorhabdus sp.]|nr:aminotransferase class I/II-fold pyridoxal phosphate-dependent enzyme [Sandarakinorhabdus sp.]
TSASAFGAVKPPAVMTTTFVYQSAQHSKDVHEAFFKGTGPAVGANDAYIYTRLGHPNLTMVETRLAALDGAEASAVFCSGMAAITTTLLAFLRPGDVVVCSRPCYGGTDGYLTTVLPDFGVTTVGMSDGCDENSIRAAITEALAAGPLRLIHLESPANPTAAIVDIAAVARIAGELCTAQGFRPIILVDNTFLGPLLQSPLAQGADLCMTSLTKYCGGHSDLMAGGISGSADLVARLKALRTLSGNHLDPFSSWLLLRSFETLALRTDRACASARTVAEFLRAHPKVAAVTYLGFIEGPARAVFDRQCRGTGSTFSFHLHGGEAEAFHLLDALKLLRLAVSLGGSETLICNPATTTHYQTPQDRREAGGIFEGTLRLSVGLEAPADLVADLAQALDAV